jgi:hypothetical protein
METTVSAVRDTIFDDLNRLQDLSINEKDMR